MAKKIDARKSTLPYLYLYLHNLFHIPVEQYSLFVLKVPLNTNQSINPTTARPDAVHITFNYSTSIAHAIRR